MRWAALVLLTACAKPLTSPPHPRVAKPDPLAASSLMAHVRALVDPALGGREAGSPGERVAIRYVADHVRALGLVPIELPVAYHTGSANLYARIEGRRRDAVIVVGAHLDHLGLHGGILYPGADDNASGVAVVLGLAATLVARRVELDRSVVLVWFGAEEPGMIGSRAFVAAPPLPLAQIAAMVNIDMIGRPLLDQPIYRTAMSFMGIDAIASVGLVGARHYPGLRALSNAAFATTGGKLVAAEDLPAEIGDEVERQSAGRGDSVPFDAAGIPALFFGDGESTDYHQPTDTIDKLTPALLEAHARSLARVVVALSRAPTTAFARGDTLTPNP